MRRPKSLMLRDLSCYYLGLTWGSVRAILLEVMERYIHTNCTYTEAYEPEHTYTFTGPCVKTKLPHRVTIPANELWELNQGGLIQCLKSLDSDDREFVKSGISPEGWRRVVADWGGHDEKSA